MSVRHWFHHTKSLNALNDISIKYNFIYKVLKVYEYSNCLFKGKFLPHETQHLERLLDIFILLFGQYFYVSQVKQITWCWYEYGNIVYKRPHLKIKT